jgi:hypothetical protein
LSCRLLSVKAPSTSIAVKMQAAGAKKKTRPRDRGLGRKAGRRGCGGKKPSVLSLHVDGGLARRCLVIQPPRIAAILQLPNDVIGNCVALCLAQPLFQAAHDLAGTHQGEGNGVSKDLASCHASLEHKENNGARRYILYPWTSKAPSDLSGRARRSPDFSLLLPGQLCPVLCHSKKEFPVLFIVWCEPHTTRTGGHDLGILQWWVTWKTPST